MGMRVLQLLMMTMLAGCVVWASAIFFGPWALMRYIESRSGDAIEVSGLKVTPKLTVTATRIQMSDGGAVIASLRGVEVDWRLLRGDEPAVLISVANGGFQRSISVEDLNVIVTQTENGYPLKVSGTAVRASDPNSVSAVDVKFDAYTDHDFQFVRHFRATTGNIVSEIPAIFTASNSQFEIQQIDLNTNLSQQDVSGRAELKNFETMEPGLTSPQLDIDFNLSDGLMILVGSARELNHDKSDAIISDLTGSIEFDISRLLLAGPINLAIDDFSWDQFRLKNIKAVTSVSEEQVSVLLEGASLGNELTLGERYVGRAPDGSFRAEIDVLGYKGDLKLSGGAMLTAVGEPVVLDLSFEGVVTDVAKPFACFRDACYLNNVIYEYVLSVAGETLSGVSRCLEATCSMAARAHNLTTSNTHKFFGNLQSMKLISPLILGAAYAKMLNGVAVSSGHEINF